MVILPSSEITSIPFVFPLYTSHPPPSFPSNLQLSPSTGLPTLLTYLPRSFPYMLLPFLLYLSTSSRFEYLCAERKLDPFETFHGLVRQYVGIVPPPFNEAARSQAGMPPEYYLPVAFKRE
eukprot:TRINITY_DN2210_c0_g1_i10.p2 TRINITY_DN2210_c0_g1~~TRINITY_DN2210_c0_g1_i10.p2  ORF type:complete len:121 (-),score=25.13 TRINITY_DN2210_c0_g1_i10:253-615(-)